MMQVIFACFAFLRYNECNGYKDRQKQLQRNEFCRKGNFGKRQMKIGCAILAGGKSSRMGRDKALLEWNGTSFIEKIEGELSMFEERLIARGANADPGGSGWTVIADRYPDRGPLAGIHAALSCCSSDALFIAACDMPLIEREQVKKFCEIMLHEGREYDAVIAAGPDGRVHPLFGIYRKTAVPWMEEQLESGNNRIMAVLEKLKVCYVRMDGEDGARVTANINTRQDYDELKKHNGLLRDRQEVQ